MILQSKGVEEEPLPQVPIIKEPTPRIAVAKPISTIVEKEEEYIAMPVERLDRYFLSSSPISKHLEAVHKHLNRTFLTDPMVSTQL